MTAADYIVYLFNFALGIGAVLAFVMIISAGIQMAESRGNPPALSAAKQKIINSLIGLAVLLTSYILLTTINPNLVNITSVSLEGTNITIPVITPGTTENNTVKAYNFEEIPIGTITEAILAGTSSKSNKIPCYEYETNTYGSDGAIIIGNTIDKNGDGKIDDNDSALDQDVMYCVKSLSKAIKDKTETHLQILTSQLISLMQSGCSCQNCYYNHFWYEPYDDCFVSTTIPCVPYIQDCDHYNPMPSKCASCHTFCTCCGTYGVGCKGASQNESVQKQYSPCKNEPAINCKRQEIKQLIDGTKPDQYCYDNNLVAPVNAETVLTYQKANERMAIFKQYYLDQVAELEKAEAKMKNPSGERITLAEFHKIENEDANAIVTKTEFDGYDTSRYCDDYCLEYGEIDEDGDGVLDGKKVCIKYEINENKRVCRMDKSKKEYYKYSGDGATFYFNSEYNADKAGENKMKEQKDNSCNIEEQDSSKEMYGGLIPIGETVDSTEDWGNEVARLLQGMADEVKGIANVAASISDFPTQCDCGSNCKQSVPITCCFCPCSGKGCCPPSCQSNVCSTCEPTAVYKDKYCNTVSVSYYTGCNTCFKKPKPIMSYKPKSKPQYYVCPFDNLCTYVKQIYAVGDIDDKCFEESASDAEESAKEATRAGVGYLQRFEIREQKLFDLSELTNLENGKFTADVTSLFPSLDCLSGCSAATTGYLSCSSSSQKEIPSRFALLDKLKLSREKLTGCVNGYGYPYKQSSNETRVLSCFEAEKSDLVILPEFPYPDKSDNKVGGVLQPYINCYPYNSNRLTTSEKEMCFYNIDQFDPGCLTITKDYMDNYYCCQ